MRFASGDIEMASHGEALVNLGIRVEHPSGFAILDLLCGLTLVVNKLRGGTQSRGRQSAGLWRSPQSDA